MAATNQVGEVKTQSGWPLSIERHEAAGALELVFRAPTNKACVLHWGIRRPARNEWEVPPAACWPAASLAVGKSAVQSPFATANGGANLVLRLDQAAAYASLDFALFFPEENRWDNNQRRNYQIPLTPANSSRIDLAEKIPAPADGSEVIFEGMFEVDATTRLLARVSKQSSFFSVMLASDWRGGLLLHWGIAQRSPREWLAPSPGQLPPNTVITADKAAQTPFATRDDFSFLQINFPTAEAPLGIQFVLKEELGGRWMKNRDVNFFVPVNPPATNASSAGVIKFQELADEIIESEMQRNSVTLMHRFNLCHEMLERVGSDTDGLALIFVWLRFSAIRQLTWQRNYNTKPRELAHAQDRLTQKLADIFRSQPDTRPLVRLMFVTVGRGGEGQRIRDEILHIMHRHHVKEVGGHFLEEWHQKLHNNTTPDDIVICEAYLEFLKSNGNLDLYFKTLADGGVTRERLESFERPIRTNPDFVPHLKDGLIHDFYQFLAILKASHSSTDLETAINATRHQLDVHLQNVLGQIWHRRNDPHFPLVELVKFITEVRRQLPAPLNAGHNVRELLYLDLALEQLLRGAIERNIHLKLNGDQLAELIQLVLENLKLSNPDAELDACLRHWERLQKQPRFSEDWSLRATSVVERIGRATGAWIDRYYRLLQPKAEYLGRGFAAENWTITLFSEEVVRGSSLGFALSMLLHHLDPILRRSAHLGDWQIVSRGRGAGKIVVTEKLQALQFAKFNGPTVIVADRVTGEEEISENVTAVIAANTTDIVSHVAVRARNAGILFASCHDTATFEKIKTLQGRPVTVEIKSDGEVNVAEGKAEVSAAAKPTKKTSAPAPRAAKWPDKFAVTMKEFSEACVGGKSSNLARLRQKLPEWLQVPASIALPFGTFDRVLKLGMNSDPAKRYVQLTAQLEKGDVEKTLAALRETVLSLNAPEELPSALRQAMNVADLPWPDDWPKAWRRIKEVWASKWNDRAFVSRRQIGLPHENLAMAVLVQEVVPADYAFVIHTVNPVNGNVNELFAEMVLGLGETLVGNHPGRALRLVCDKKTGQHKIQAYPSKSTGLFGSGLIFRSDSNGEDLAGYAGAGLYDSVLLEPPVEKTLDYAHEPLVGDEHFQREIFGNILRLGLEVEKAFGSPQDIEGAVTQGKFFVVQSRPQVGLK